MSSVTNFVKVAVKKLSTNKLYSEHDRDSHCEAWRQSGLSMNQYCQQTGVALSSLSKWLNQRRQQKMISTKSSLSTDEVGVAKQGFEIILVNGLCLRFPQIVNRDEIVKLVQVLLKWE